MCWGWNAHEATAFVCLLIPVPSTQHRARCVVGSYWMLLSRQWLNEWMHLLTTPPPPATALSPFSSYSSSWRAAQVPSAAWTFPIGAPNVSGTCLCHNAVLQSRHLFMLSYEPKANDCLIRVCITRECYSTWLFQPRKWSILIRRLSDKQGHDENRTCFLALHSGPCDLEDHGADN